jgi:hypothetical protein
MGNNIFIIFSLHIKAKIGFGVLLLLFSFTSLLTPHRTLVNTHKINKCAKFGSILKQLSTNQKVSKQTVKKILLEAHRHQWSLDRNKCSDGKLRTYVKFKTVYGRENCVQSF